MDCDTPYAIKTGAAVRFSRADRHSERGAGGENMNEEELHKATDETAKAMDKWLEQNVQLPREKIGGQSLSTTALFPIHEKEARHVR